VKKWIDAKPTTAGGTQWVEASRNTEYLIRNLKEMGARIQKIQNTVCLPFSFSRYSHGFDDTEFS
jgi:hypothetical protein